MLDKLIDDTELTAPQNMVDEEVDRQLNLLQQGEMHAIILFLFLP